MTQSGRSPNHGFLNKMTDNLEQIATYEDEASAEIVAGMLRIEGVPVEVRPDSPLPGLVNKVKVLVPESLAHRARWLIKASAVSEVELNFAATGELSDPE
jgi:hypothetical protein